MGIIIICVKTGVQKYKKLGKLLSIVLVLRNCVFLYCKSVIFEYFYIYIIWFESCKTTRFKNTHVHGVPKTIGIQWRIGYVSLLWISIVIPFQTHNIIMSARVYEKGKWL